MKEKGRSEAEGCVMDGGMIGVVKEGTRHEERQMDHHDNTPGCVHVQTFLLVLLAPHNMCFADDCVIRAYYCDNML